MKCREGSFPAYGKLMNEKEPGAVGSLGRGGWETETAIPWVFAKTNINLILKSHTKFARHVIFK